MSGYSQRGGVYYCLYGSVSSTYQINNKFQENCWRQGLTVYCGGDTVLMICWKIVIVRQKNVRPDLM